MKNPLHVLFIAIIALMLAYNAAFATSDAKSFLLSGEAKFKSKDFNGAIADYTKALELNPKYVEAYLNRGLAKRSVGDAEGAKVDLKKSIDLDPTPKDAAAYYYRALAKSALGDNDGALSDFKKAADHGNANAKEWLKNNNYK
ncbi:MAG: tetratricopeptide repeat protein [Chlorobiaceae bacterium]